MKRIGVLFAIAGLFSGVCAHAGGQTYSSMAGIGAVKVSASVGGDEEASKIWMNGVLLQLSGLGVPTSVNGNYVFNVTARFVCRDEIHICATYIEGHLFAYANSVWDGSQLLGMAWRDSYLGSSRKGNEVWDQISAAIELVVESFAAAYKIDNPTQPKSGQTKGERKQPQKLPLHQR